MDKNPTFFRLCVREAARGTFELANAIATIVGGAILAAVVWWLGGEKMEAPTSVPRTIVFGVVLSILSLLVSWVVVFLWRLYGAPSRLYWSERKTIKDLEKEKLALEERLVPKIRVFLNSTDKGVTEHPTEDGASSKWVQFRVSCATETPLIACEAFLTTVTKIDGDERGPELVEEPIHCNWSQRPESDIKITISPQVAPYVNLFTLYGNSVVPQTALRKFRLGKAIQTPGKYQVGVVVTADNTTSAPAALRTKQRKFSEAETPGNVPGFFFW